MNTLNGSTHLTGQFSHSIFNLIRSLYLFEGYGHEMATFLYESSFEFLKYTKKLKDFKSSYIKWVIEYVVVTWVFVIIFSTFALLSYEWKIAGGEFRNLYFKFNTSNMYWGDMKLNFGYYAKEISADNIYHCNIS